MGIDFEELVEQQDESEMPQYVLWVEIESRHMNKLAKTWTIICIMLQSIVISFMFTIYA